MLIFANFLAWITGNRPDGPADIVLLAAITSLPLLPIVGFHLNQAYRQFRAGHTLADLRSALDVARRERAETEALTQKEKEPTSHLILRYGTVASATWLATTFGLLLQGAIHENRTGLQWFLLPVLSTMVLGAVSNALDVQFVPSRIRKWWQTGIRDRLWNKSRRRVARAQARRARTFAARGTSGVSRDGGGVRRRRLGVVRGVAEIVS